MRNQNRFLISEIVKSRVDKIVSRTFKKIPEAKFPSKIKQDNTPYDPKELFLKVFDKDHIILEESLIHDSNYHQKRSSKIFMSHIMGIKNIEEMMGKKQLINYKIKIRKISVCQSSEKLNSLKPDSFMKIESKEQRRFSSLDALPRVPNQFSIKKS